MSCDLKKKTHKCLIFGNIQLLMIAKSVNITILFKSESKSWRKLYVLSTPYKSYALPIPFESKCGTLRQLVPMGP